MNALDNIVAQAEQAAANFNAPAIATPQGGAVAAYRPSLEDAFDQGGLMVDEWLQVKPEGFRVGKTMKLIEDLTVEIDFADVVPCRAARGENGGTTRYLRTYDGVTTAQGGNYQLELANLTKWSEKQVAEYATFEIPMSLVEDLTDAKGTVLFSEGTTVGFTPAVMAAKAFAKFGKRVRDQGLLRTGPLQVRITHKKQTNARGQEYGVLEFALAADAVAKAA